MISINLNALAFLSSVNNQPRPEHFEDAYISDYIKFLLPSEKKSDLEIKRLTLRFKAQIFMYVRTILVFRSL